MLRRYSIKLEYFIQHLNANISYEMAKNVTVKAQLGATGVPPQVPPPPGMYPHPPLMDVIIQPYMMKPQGLQVSLVPIPKLKPRAVLLVPKSSKKVEKKKSWVKTKKDSSFSFLGVLFLMLLFGGLVPLLKVRYGGLIILENTVENIIAHFVDIESVLPSEKAMASHGSAYKKNAEARMAS
ncbi:hypothetical protein RDI58_010977 [Solanum bulbocastanum]|uniref:Uncharacterized protein n=1 Tax=Solanum bulbocastanum TaxID=147425 RepID=A0AAN8TUR3_SOLBU